MNRLRSTVRLRSDPQFNMTPMIDVVFLLIIFFMLVCQFITQENYQLVLPDDCPGAVVPDSLDQDAVTVSALPNPRPSQSLQPGAVIYAVRGRQFDPQSDNYRGQPDRLLAEMANRITIEAADRSERLVHLRADRDLTYRDVQPALLALARAGITRVQLAAFRSENSHAAGASVGGPQP